MPRLQYFNVWKRIWYGLIGLVTVLSLVPNLVIPVDNADKLEHISVYATLMVWHVWLYETGSGRIVCALLLCGMGVGLEYLQAMTSYRMFDRADMIANAVGVGLGLAVAMLKIPNGLLWMERTLLKAASRASS